MNEKLVATDVHYEPSDLREHPDLRAYEVELDRVAAKWGQAPPKPEAMPAWLAKEHYQESLMSYRAVGACAINGSLETAEGQKQLERLRRDFYTSLVEIFENEKDFRGKFEVNDVYEYDIRDEQVMSSDGRPMVQLVTDGAAKSRAAAREDKLMETQARRDTADIPNAVSVDEIAAGKTLFNTRMVLSRHLGKAIAANPEYWRRKGYREGLSFFQLYYVDGTKLRTGTFSVVDIEDRVFLEVLAEEGLIIPPDANGDEWTKHGIERKFNSWEEAQAFAKAVRQRCYEKQGDRRTRLSVNEFIHIHQAKLDQAFRAFNIPLSGAIASGVKTSAIAQYVEGLLAHPAHLKPETVTKLQSIHERDEFTDADGRLLAGFALYAAAEHLYEPFRSFAYTQSGPRWQRPPELPPQQLVNVLVRNTLTGARAGRKHGGPCPGVVDISSESNTGSDRADENPQAPYGGNKGRSVEASAATACDYMHDGCYCCPYNFDGSKRGSRLRVMATRGKDGIAYCRRTGCGAWLPADGTVGFKGYIAQKAERLQNEKAKGSSNQGVKRDFALAA